MKKMILTLMACGIAMAGSAQRVNQTILGGVRYAVDKEGRAYVKDLADESVTDVVLRKKVLINRAEYTVAYIGTDAFANNTTIETVDCAGIEQINKGAFVNCTAVHSLNLDGVKYFDQGYYWGSFNDMAGGCTSLTSVTIPESLDYNPNFFNDCTTIKDVTINSKFLLLRADFTDSCMSSDMFNGCTSLERVTINCPIIWDIDYLLTPNPLDPKDYLHHNFYSSQSNIGAGMFKGCVSLKELNMEQMTYYPTGALRDLPSLHCGAAYSAAPGWRDFRSIIEKFDLGVEEISDDVVTG